MVSYLIGYSTTANGRCYMIICKTAKTYINVYSALYTHLLGCGDMISGCRLRESEKRPPFFRIFGVCCRLFLAPSSNLRKHKIKGCVRSASVVLHGRRDRATSSHRDQIVLNEGIGKKTHFWWEVKCLLNCSRHTGTNQHVRKPYIRRMPQQLAASFNPPTKNSN